MRSYEFGFSDDSQKKMSLPESLGHLPSRITGELLKTEASHALGDISEGVLGALRERSTLNRTQPSLSDIGSMQWLVEVHIPLLRLYKLAALEALQGLEEIAVPWLFSEDLKEEENRARLLVRELICAEVSCMHIRGASPLSNWNCRDEGSIQFQCLEAHESHVAALIELLIYHNPIQRALGTSSLDLLEYAYRKVCRCNSWREKSRSLSQLLAWSSGYDDCLTRSRSRVQFSMPTSF